MSGYAPKGHKHIAQSRAALGYEVTGLLALYASSMHLTEEPKLCHKHLAIPR